MKRKTSVGKHSSTIKDIHRQWFGKNQASFMLSPFFAILLALSCLVFIAHTQEEIMHNQGTTRALIVDMVRAAGSDSEINVNPLSDSQKRSGFTGANEVIQEWIKENGESIIDTRGGPFESTDQYVTTYKDGRIYVHVLSWDGKNNITLPAITDRVVKNAWILEHPTADGASWGIVRQHPWGLLIVVPEEYQNGVDDIVVLDIEGDPATLKKPRLVETDPSRLSIFLGTAPRQMAVLRTCRHRTGLRVGTSQRLSFRGR